MPSSQDRVIFCPGCQAVTPAVMEQFSRSLASLAAEQGEHPHAGQRHHLATPGIPYGVSEPRMAGRA